MDVSPSQVLFIDDGVRNVDAARALGLNAELARGPEEARDVLVRHGVLSDRQTPGNKVAAKGSGLVDPL
jgi:FMN phosphatase YigB (HAD superfamily)